MVSSPSDIDNALRQQQEELLWAALTLRLTQEAQVPSTSHPSFLSLAVKASSQELSLLFLQSAEKQKGQGLIQAIDKEERISFVSQVLNSTSGSLTAFFLSGEWKEQCCPSICDRTAACCEE